MIPVDQTILDAPNGNCFAACVASIFHLPIEAVPNFCGDHWHDADQFAWMKAFREWLKPRGLGALCLNPAAVDFDQFCGAILIAGGEAPRGCQHAVLWQSGKVLHDPHPSREGIRTLDDVTLIFSLGESPP